MALKNDGTLWVWGSNVYGQLGNGTTNQSKVPVQISLSNVIQIACGEEQSLALKSDGTVWAWGNNNLGQLGNGNNTQSNLPVQVLNLGGVTDISTLLGDHCVALKSDGTVWTWGYNFYGQLGNNSTANSNIPVQVLGLTGVKDVEAGGNHCHAMKTDGSIWGWGGNVNGELGDGTSSSKKTPVNVGDLCVYKVVGINEQVDDTQGLVYPNPTKDIVVIKVVKESVAVLFDQTGRNVYEKKIVTGSNELDLSLVPCGIYQLRLISGETVQYIKVVKAE